MAVECWDAEGYAPLPVCKVRLGERGSLVCVTLRAKTGRTKDSTHKSRLNLGDRA